MRKSIKKQLGLSFIGLCMMLGILAIFVLFVLTAFPLYNDYFKTKSIMQAVATLPPDQAKRNSAIYMSFIKNARINGLNRINSGSVKEAVTITNDKQRKKKSVNVKFDASNKLFKNLYLMMVVDETIELNTE